MIEKVKKSLSEINYKLLVSLFFVGIVPSLYTTLRVFFLGQIPGEYAFSIAGQLSWVNLLYEILNEAIILPLYFFIGKVISDKKELTMRIKSGMLITFLLYLGLSLIIIAFTSPILSLMAVNKDIISSSSTYIRIESVALIFSVLANFSLIVLISLDREKYIYLIVVIRLVLNVVFDTFFVSGLDFSFKLGVNGIGISNIVINLFVLMLGLVLMKKEGIYIFSKQPIRFSWLNELFKVGGISGVESFVRNLAYMFMVSRMVNIVNEQGTYWVANNFIWGWLLLPITQLGEYIKKDVATDFDAIKNKTLAYFTITTVICLIWFATIPLWKPFMENILMFDDVDKLYNLVMLLVGFYVLYAFQNVFDSTFYGIGKTNYMLFESVVTNTLYYGTAFVLFITKIWTPTLTSIALMFGIGVAFDSFVSLGVYIYLLKKKKINILNTRL